MPKFRILMQRDAFVELTAVVDAETLEAAVDQAYSDRDAIQWKRRGIQSYDACRVVGIDENDTELGSYSRGKF